MEHPVAMTRERERDGGSEKKPKTPSTRTKGQSSVEFHKFPPSKCIRSRIEKP